MDFVRTVLKDPVVVANATYDYFLYENCGVAGLVKEFAKHQRSYFISKLTDRIKMNGLTANCIGTGRIRGTVYDVDRVGPSLVRYAPFDCNRDGHYESLPAPQKAGRVLNRYEREMGKLITKNVHGIEATFRPEKHFEWGRTHGWGSAVDDAFVGTPRWTECHDRKTRRVSNHRFDPKSRRKRVARIELELAKARTNERSVVFFFGRDETDARFDRWRGLVVAASESNQIAWNR